jgi:mRNA interferase MazF
VSEPPEAGDLVWFNPQSGHEQAGRRPALVLSPRSYHTRTALAVVCPITSNMAPYPFKVMMPEGLAFAGAVLADPEEIGSEHLRHSGSFTP